MCLVVKASGLWTTSPPKSVRRRSSAVQNIGSWKRSLGLGVFLRCACSLTVFTLLHQLSVSSNDEALRRLTEVKYGQDQAEFVFQMVLLISQSKMLPRASTTTFSMHWVSSAQRICSRAPLLPIKSRQYLKRGAWSTKKRMVSDRTYSLRCSRCCLNSSDRTPGVSLQTGNCFPSSSV